MGALSYAAVPLYQMFCQVTGYGGTTQRAEKAPDQVFDRKITIRFDANVTPGMDWDFAPEQQTVDVKVGESTLAFYKASNTADRAITGTASFNVSPDVAGRYFSKIECFCFKEQTLQAGESVDMPVSFFVDPSIMKDRDAEAVKEITLSYTFYPSEPSVQAPSAKSAAREGS
jgi:cytochrome c oxidase assembly protein subunit 11